VFRLSIIEEFHKFEPFSPVGRFPFGVFNHFVPSDAFWRARYLETDVHYPTTTTTTTTTTRYSMAHTPFEDRIGGQ
jgi:hypothetical protein